MNPLRSVGSRLAAALALVVAIALGAAWMVIVPPLERNLERAKLDQQERRAEIVEDDPDRPFPIVTFTTPEVDAGIIADWAGRASTLTNARVLVYRIAREPELELTVEVDSQGQIGSTDLGRNVIARQAALYGRPTRGFVARDGIRYTEVGRPMRHDGQVVAIVLYSSSLEDTLASVEQTKRRLLVAGGLALGVAMLLGFAAASLFARRIRRLERAADRIAGGRLDEPVVDRGRDELGQLAGAFERMRTQLARLDHARKEFIANASHELRTPIFSLGGFLELIASEELDEATRREFIATMQEQLARLGKLATDLLDLSRLDAGQLSLELEPVDIAGVAEALREEFAAIALSSGHAVDVRRPAWPVEALADETRTLQIGRALLENALRHTPGGTDITLNAGRVDGRAVLSVEDAGPGIPAEQVRQVFERFQRGERAHAPGSGLGLAIARELADAMGGRVVLDSRPGRTVFRLELPAAERSRDAVSTRKRSPAGVS